MPLHAIVSKDGHKLWARRHPSRRNAGWGRNFSLGPRPQRL